MREKAPAGWKGDDTREKQVLNALFPIMSRDRQATQAIFRDHQEPTRLLMSETIQLGEISIRVTRKDIKNVHLSVHPPSGRVTLVAPTATRLDVARAYAISKLGWIREQQKQTAEPGAGSAAPVCRARKPLSLGTAPPSDGRLSATPNPSSHSTTSASR